MLKPSRATDYNIPIISPPVKHPKHCFDWWYRLFVIKLKKIYYTCAWHVLSEVMKRKAVDWCRLIRELKQTDLAAERRRSISKFLFRRTQDQVNSLGPWHHSLFNWMEIWMWPRPLGRLSLRSLILLFQNATIFRFHSIMLWIPQKLTLRQYDLL